MDFGISELGKSSNNTPDPRETRRVAGQCWYLLISDPRTRPGFCSCSCSHWSTQTAPYQACWLPKNRLLKSSRFLFNAFFVRARVYWPLLCKVAHFLIFESRLNGFGSRSRTLVWNVSMDKREKLRNARFNQSTVPILLASYGACDTSIKSFLLIVLYFQCGVARVRRSSNISESACCTAAPSSIPGSAPLWKSLFWSAAVWNGYQQFWFKCYKGCLSLCREGFLLLPFND